MAAGSRSSIRLGALGGDAAQVGRRGRGRQHQRQGNHRETKPRDARRNQHMVGVCNIQAEEIEGYMFQRLEVIEDRQRKEEKEDRQRGQYRQRYIQAAVKLLPRAAMGTFGKMLLVVLAHLRCDPGDVISPACQDGACYSVRASGSCHNR